MSKPILSLIHPKNAPNAAHLAAGLFLFMLYLALSMFFRSLYEDSFPLMMAWNAFLAFIPFVFALAVSFLFHKKRYFLSVFFGCAWLLFFPNAHYMITDFIHLGGMRFYENGAYFYELDKWCFLFHIAFGMVLSLRFGLVSMDLIYSCLKEKYNTPAAFFTITAVSYLSGYAIYIGRFIRLNSWDILRPMALMETLFSQINRFSLCFSLLAGTYILFTFAAYRLIRAVRL